MSNSTEDQGGKPEAGQTPAMPAEETNKPLSGEDLDQVSGGVNPFPPDRCGRFHSGPI